MQSESLLVEIGTEELPPKALQQLSEALKEGICSGLKSAELEFGEVNAFASPRRLAVHIRSVAAQQQDKVVEKRGPAVQAAFDENGEPTKAAMGWAKGVGIEVSQADRLRTDKGEWLLHKAAVKGQTTATLLPAMIEQAIKRLPIPKPMRWGEGQTQFIRPVHNVCVMLGKDVVDATLLGVRTSASISGHRFHSPEWKTLDHADEYETTLQSASVVADFDKRKAQIRQGLLNAADSNQAQVDMDEALLDEVTALVEWPVVLVAEFDERFLDVPKEALIYTMKDDQKYFPLLSSEGALLPRFAFVSNISSHDPSQVIKGNERVIRPRLADAEFFFESDKKRGLASRVDDLSSVLFQKQLGTLKDKVDRIADLARLIAKEVDANADAAYRAGLLSKTDLMTQMVMEFPDVQGVMGMHYARHDGEPEAVAVALYEQYLPRFSGDELPSLPESYCVALADKLDSLVGLFGIGQPPKGDKDPFALRRAAIGLIRILVEKGLNLDLVPLLEHSVSLYGDKLSNGNTVTEVTDFVLGRFRAWYQDQSIDVNTVQAVLERRPTRPADFDARIKAVEAFRQQPEAESLAAANKRVANILRKNDVDISNVTVDKTLLVESAESALCEALDKVEAEVSKKVDEADYGQALVTLATLQSPVDRFFEEVMVMAEDDAVRNNRLALLARLRALFLNIADISVL